MQNRQSIRSFSTDLKYWGILMRKGISEMKTACIAIYLLWRDFSFYPILENIE